MAPLFQHFVPLSAVTPVIFCWNLKRALLSAAEELVIAPGSVKAGSSLYYCQKLPDVFE